MGIYKQYALELVEKGHAFYCFATAEELDQMRAEDILTCSIMEGSVSFPAPTLINPSQLQWPV